MTLLTDTIAAGITGFTRALTGAKARWLGCGPSTDQRIYFANHNSHADFVLIWASLPPALRVHTRPVAGADYWEKGALKKFVIHDVLNGVLIDRTRSEGAEDPIAVMVEALDAGDSLILFPEGTRNTTDEVLLPFKSGLYHVAAQRPEVDLIPVWMENLGRVLPKGETIPVPLLCSIAFGTPLRLEPNEDKTAFLDRARAALLAVRDAARPQ